MGQPSELDTLVALWILIDLLRAEGDFARPVVKTRQPKFKPARR